MLNRHIEGIISDELMKSILHSLARLNALNRPDYTILIHGMGGQTHSFYKSLKKQIDVEVLWTGWSSKIWWTHIFRSFAGQGGLVKVKNLQALEKIFREIRLQSMSGLYFVPTKLVEEIKIDTIKNRNLIQFERILKDEEDFFILVVNSGKNDGVNGEEVIIKEVIMGNNLDSEIRKILTQGNFEVLY